MKQAFSVSRLLPVTMIAATMLLGAGAQAAAPGITPASGATGPVFNLTAQPAFISQPDGNYIYSWGYGCDGAPSGFAPAAIAGATCSSMQIPGPTLIVTAPPAGTSTTVTVQLRNNLPTAAGNTSILFPGFQVATSGGVDGLLTKEAVPGGGIVS